MLLTFFVLTSTSSIKNKISRENNSGCCIGNKCLCNNNAYRHIIIALGATLWITTTMSTSDNAGGGLNDLCHDLFLIFLKSKSSVQNSSSSSWELSLNSYSLASGQPKSIVRQLRLSYWLISHRKNLEFPMSSNFTSVQVKTWHQPSWRLFTLLAYLRSLLTMMSSLLKVL